MQTIIQITLGQIVTASAIITLLLALLQWLLAKWISIRLEKSIQHEYDKKMELYKFSQLQRQKATLVSDFFAKWAKFRAREDKFLTEREQVDYYEELNRMSFEISLWMKDESLLKEIMSLFSLKAGSSDMRTLLGRVRKLILEKDDNFDPQEIVIWPSPTVADKLFKL